MTVLVERVQNEVDSARLPGHMYTHVLVEARWILPSPVHCSGKCCYIR